MSFQIISINWTAQQLSAEQLLVLRNVAALVLRREMKNPIINFTHTLLDGVITRKSEGVFVTFCGTFFHADMGSVNGERWTVDFLLPRNSEKIAIDESAVILSSRPLKNGEVEIQQVDTSLAQTSEASLLGPH